LSVTGIGVKGEALREFSPLYGQGKASHGAENPSYYSVHRRQRLPSAKQKIQGHRSNYLGGEVFLSLMDGKAGPFDGDLSQLGVQTLCTNRDLPLRLILGGGRSDFTVESGAPVESVRVVAGPSAPKASPVGGEMSWRLISHLSLNYLSFADGDDDRGTAALRELLELYADMGDAHAARQIAGVQSCATKPVVRRLPFPGPVTFGRGIELTLRVDDSAFEGTSAFLLGVVLDRFFSRYVSMNSFTETVLRSAERGEVARWPMKVGSRPSL
jgi:type VI secretion system protein ImpG